MITTSIVARRGWIIPAPFAIPPTVKPSAARRPRASGPESVVRIAPGGRLAAVGGELRRPRRARPRAPCRPEAARRSRRSRGRRPPRARAPARAASACGGGDGVRLALRSGRRVRAAGVDQHRLRLGLPRDGASRRSPAPPGRDWSSRPRRRRRAAPSARRRGRACPDGRSPAVTPLATKPLAAVTDMLDRDPSEPEPGRVGEPERPVDVLDRLARPRPCRGCPRRRSRSCGR